jgi:hypothetical protein
MIRFSHLHIGARFEWEGQIWEKSGQSLARNIASQRIELFPRLAEVELIIAEGQSPFNLGEVAVQQVIEAIKNSEKQLRQELESQLDSVASDRLAQILHNVELIMSELRLHIEEAGRRP